MKVAITGASGFIGKNLCTYLQNLNYEIVPIIRTEPKNGFFTETLKIEPVIADVRDYPALLESFTGVDAVIHLAALFNNPENSLKDYEEINVEGTRNTITAAHAAGVKKIIYCSTIGVAIDSGQTPYNEDSPYAFPESDKYESTKYKAERLVLELHEKENIPVTVIRPAQVYGPGDTSKVKFYKMVQKGVMINPSRTMKHLIYIDDLCEAFHLTLQSNITDGEVIIIGERSATPLKEMIRISAEKLNVPQPKFYIPQRPMLLMAGTVEALCGWAKIKPPIFKRSMDFFVRSVELDVSKAKDVLGFSSRTNAKQGIDKTIEWYKSQGLL